MVRSLQLVEVRPYAEEELLFGDRLWTCKILVVKYSALFTAICNGKNGLIENKTIQHGEISRIKTNDKKNCFCQVQVQDLLTYLYGQRHDIYGSHACVRRAGSLIFLPCDVHGAVLLS